METLWADLKDSEAPKAWRAVWRLAAFPKASVPFLRDRIKPLQPAAKDITGPLLAELATESFARRDAATKRLKELAHSAEPAMREQLTTNLPLEVRQRLELLLRALAEAPPPLTPAALRDLRV